MSFSTSVDGAQQATRANSTIINWKQTWLPPSEEKVYYRVDENGNVESETKTFYAGLFGCYTGSYTWAQLIGLSAKADPTDDEKEILKQYYSANQLYNVQANIGPAVNGITPLTYSPQQFWPNDGKMMTFWGYYPYNATAIHGEYGIGIVNNEEGVGEGMGMGHVHFTMNSDASQQNDFLISAPAIDCTRDNYPLVGDGSGNYSPKPVRLQFYHMLAQVRIYAYVVGTDKLVYKDGEYYEVNETYLDEYGIEHTVTEAGTVPKIDEEKSIRWKRTNIFSVDGKRKRADISYSMEFNNIKTSASFYPAYSVSGTTIGCTPAMTMGSATINHYIMNPYWFTFNDQQQREILNDNYMFGYYEDTPVYKRENASTTDGIDWSNTEKWGTVDNSHRDPLSYMAGMDDDHKKLLLDPDVSKHYNFATGNILLVVPQELHDDDVPHIVITANGKRRVWNSGTSSWDDDENLTAKVTINMLKMGIKWESGFIYCYAFLDDLQPGDDKVRGPESITVVFDKTQYTDQW